MTEAHRCEKLAQSFYAIVPGRDSNPRPLDHESDTLPQHHDATLYHTKDHLASLSEKRLVGGVDSFYFKIWVKLITLERITDFQSIFARSASAVIPGEKLMVCVIYIFVDKTLLMIALVTTITGGGLA